MFLGQLKATPESVFAQMERGKLHRLYHGFLAGPQFAGWLRYRCAEARKQMQELFFASISHLPAKLHLVLSSKKEMEIIEVFLHLKAVLHDLSSGESRSPMGEDSKKDIRMVAITILEECLLKIQLQYLNPDLNLHVNNK